MGGINIGRWLAGGVVAATIIFVLEGTLGSLYSERTEQAWAAHNITVSMDASLLGWAIALNLLTGLVLIFFYAAARTRFGAGAKTAVIVAVAMTLGSAVPTLIGYRMLNLYPGDLLTTWAVQLLVEYLIATMAGALVYKEPAAQVAS